MLVRRLIALNFCLLLLAVGALSQGCAGAQARFEFSRLSYPVSMTSVLLGPNGSLLRKEADLMVVAEVEHKYSRFASCYTLAASDAPDEDPATALNRLIRRHGGIGMVDTTITNESCSWNYFIPFTLLPFWVGCTRTLIRGKVVRFGTRTRTNR